MEGIRRAQFELGDEVEVEVSSLGGLGVYEQATAADVVGQLHEAGKHILEQACSQTSTFMVGVDAQPTK